MDITSFVGRIICIVYLSVGIGSFVNPKFYQQIIKDMFKNKGLVFFTGFCTTLMSFLLVSYHNIWQGWAIIITLFGWIGLVKGVLFMIMPTQMEKMSKSLFTMTFSRVISVVCILLGLLAGYLWFL